jgi:2-polyprenyl-3-methyl-5-hydroxy-6-metoxy-1,4-benzoquinol methylase
MSQPDVDFWEGMYPTQNVLEAMRINLQSPNGTVRYSDSKDHFENGVLRLLRLNASEFDRWLDFAEREADGDLLMRLGRSYARLRPVPVAEHMGSLKLADHGPLGVRGRVWHPSIAENPSFGVAMSLDGSIGWLLRQEHGHFRREMSPPEYEADYFESDGSSAQGYGAYAAQASWRLEKSRRQVRDIQRLTGLSGGCALDVGCGYGYFRRALDEAGFLHEGLEVSNHARAVAERLFGFRTHPGTLAEYAADWHNRYDLITLWDVIEHVAEPSSLLSQVAQCLSAEGIVAIKTPNLDCPEAECFGPYYHSLKREHLLYFTAASLTTAARGAGLTPVHVGSASHLLVGFFGKRTTEQWAKELRGADLIAYFKPAGESES